VSPMASYRHLASKDDLLASVAAEGFRELAAATQSATLGASPFTRAV
jgi:AcrR family transcriptional regulator